MLPREWAALPRQGGCFDCVALRPGQRSSQFFIPFLYGNLYIPAHIPCEQEIVVDLIYLFAASALFAGTVALGILCAKLAERKS